MRRPVVRRILLSSRGAPAGRPDGPGVGAAGATAGACAGAGSAAWSGAGKTRGAPVSSAAMSSRTMRPPGPVPETLERSIPCSAASRFTNGEARSRSPEPVAAAPGAGDDGEEPRSARALLQAVLEFVQESGAPDQVRRGGSSSGLKGVLHRCLRVKVGETGETGETSASLPPWILLAIGFDWIFRCEVVGEMRQLCLV